MRVIFAGGGTGGHINPAISIADYIKGKDEAFEALFIGTEKGLETKLVPKAGYNIEYIDIQGFNRRSVIKNIDVLRKLDRARSKCRQIIKDFKADAVVCTGGYVSGPVAIATRHVGVGSLIHEQNVYPGLTVKGAQNYVDFVATSFPETKEHIKRKDKCVLTGNPVREEILKADYHTSRKKLGISDKPLLLVFGGSLGAAKINENIVEVIPRLIKDGKIQLIFGTGERNYAEISQKLKGIALPEDFKILPYIDNMAEVMAASDIVVSRSGAITVSEIAAMGKPSIMIPSPNVARNHQEQNARAFEAQDAAEVLCEPDLNPDSLYEKINSLISDKDRLINMGNNVKKLAEPEALEKIYTLVKKCADITSSKK